MNFFYYIIALLFLLNKKAFSNICTNQNCPNNNFEDEESNIEYCVPYERLEEGKTIPAVDPEEDQPESYPPWYSRELAIKGQAFARRNLYLIFMALIDGSVLQAISQSHTLDVFTSNGMFKTPALSAKRLTSNLLQNKVWYEEDPDPIDKSDNSSSSIFYDSVIMVRNIHQFISYKLNAGEVKIRDNKNRDISDFQPKMWEAFKKDLAESDLYKEYKMLGKIDNNKNYHNSFNSEINETNILLFNQYDSTLGLWMNLCLPITRTKELGLLDATDEELWGFVHLWAGIAFLMGLKDKFNIGVQPDLKSAQNICERIMADNILPNIFKLNMDREHEEISEKIIEGFIGIAPAGIDSKAWYLSKTIETILGIPCNNLRKESGWSGWTLQSIYDITKPFVKYSWFQTLGNYYFNMNIKIAGLKFFGVDGFNSKEISTKAFSKVREEDQENEI